MKHKHTPGPWEVREAVRRLEVLTTGDAWFPVWHADDTEPRSEGEANARLIAAAPDGLDAAERAYLAFLGLPESARGSIPVQTAMVALRDYIAKATGLHPRDVQDEFEARRLSRKGGVL